MNAEQFDKILCALEAGHNCAIEVANDVHLKYAGYKPSKHAAVDADVNMIEQGIEALHAVREQQLEGAIK